MNAEAEKWIEQNLSRTIDPLPHAFLAIVMREAIRFAYADAAKVCRVKPGTDPADIIGGEEGVLLCNSLAEAIEGRAR